MAQNVAPVITVFDHRGCDRANLVSYSFDPRFSSVQIKFTTALKFLLIGSQEYQGAKANGEDDYMCVKIKAEVRNRSEPHSIHVIISIHRYQQPRKLNPVKPGLLPP